MDCQGRAARETIEVRVILIFVFIDSIRTIKIRRDKSVLCPIKSPIRVRIKNKNAISFVMSK